MKKQHAITLLEIIADLPEENHKLDSVLVSAVREYFNAIRSKNPRKALSAIELEFTKKSGILQSHLRRAFIEIKKEELSRFAQAEKIKSAKLENEKKYSIKEIAEMMGVTIQNVNNHLRNLKGKINVIENSPRKRFLTESEYKKFKSLI